MGAHMKIIVFSDSHRELTHMQDVISREKPDYVFHLGDHDSDAQQISRSFQLLPVVSVRGNCDGWSDTPKTLTVRIGSVTFFLCHGHTLGVKSGNSTAVYAAMEQNADVLLYGHTHEAFYECMELQGERALYVLNPGACGCGSRPTYGFFLLENGRFADWGIRYCKG